MSQVLGAQTYIEGTKSMAVSINSIQSICDAITRDVELAYNGLSLYFVIHGVGKMRESIALAEHEIITHRAGNAARAIIRKHTQTERSSFLGIAIASESKMMGFKKTDHILGLFTINKDNFESEEEARAEIYHLVWHAIDLYEIRQDPSYRRKFKTGPMVPKRSPLNLNKAHLQADAFAATLAALRGDKKMLPLISKKRGLNSLSTISDFKAEDFPSIIAMEACEFAISDLMQQPIEKENQLQIARKLSLDVGYAFDEHNIQQWWDFCIPAQDMAWRGFSKEEILGAAVNTSNNPFVRSMGYLVQEVTEIEPMTAARLRHNYNAFIDPAMNLKLHREMVDSIFEEAVLQGVEEASSQAFLEAANKQNEDLTEGRILGWCANALQDAARAFERALLNGAAPDQAARMQFEGNKTDPEWETLKELGDNIVDQRRQGFAVTMGHIAEICHNNPAFAPILGSLKITMNDPSYIQKLEASNDLAMTPTAPTPKGLAPKGPAPKGPAPTAPELSYAPAAPAMPAAPTAAAPSLGGKGNRARIMQERRRQQILAQQQAQNSTEGSGDNSTQQ